MGEERGGDIDVDDIHLEISRKQGAESFIHKEISVCRSKNYSVENGRHRGESSDKDDYQSDKHPENRPAQDLQMVPE